MDTFAPTSVLNWASILLAFLATGLWLKAAAAGAPADPDGYGLVDTGNGRTFEVRRRSARQAAWDRRAACVTALAVLGQAALLLLKATS